MTTIYPLTDPDRISNSFNCGSMRFSGRISFVLQFLLMFAFHTGHRVVFGFVEQPVGLRVPSNGDVHTNCVGTISAMVNQRHQRTSLFHQVQQRPAPVLSSSYDPNWDFDDEYEYDGADCGKGGAGAGDDDQYLTDREEKNQNLQEVDKAVPSSSTSKAFFSRKTLEEPSFRLQSNDNGLFEKLCAGAGIERPSKIQSMAWPVLLRGQHAVIADQTGSGKTLAYLVPLLQRALLLSDSSADDSRASDAKKRKNIPGSPRVLILAPTAELADQTRIVCDKLSQHVPFKTMVVTATGKYSTSIRDQIRMLQRKPVDVLISTPGRIATILRTRNSGLDLNHLQAVSTHEIFFLICCLSTFLYAFFCRFFKAPYSL